MQDRKIALSSPPKNAPRANDNEPVDQRQIPVARLIWRRRKVEWLARLKRFLLPPKAGE